ncbi:MAG TPA: NTP transferase domain-containing protein [bacterium]|nr:NTP transferase domain-containing protein [bacterium]
MAILLAAGEGKRMKSDLPKVLHEAAGEPLLAHVGRAARESGLERVVVVVGRGADRVRERFANRGWEFVEQPERLGTGDAVKRARAQIDQFTGDIVVLAGDAPLLRGTTLTTLRQRHHQASAAATVLTAHLSNPTGYGRIVRDANGTFVGIVEEKDATEEQRRITEVNSSIYCFDARELGPSLDALTNHNAQGEYYLTDAIGILRSRGKIVQAVLAASPEEILGVNTPDQLREVEDALVRRRSEESARRS